MYLQVFHTTFFHIFSFQYQIWCVCVCISKLRTGSPYGGCFLRAGLTHGYIHPSWIHTWELGQADFDSLSDRASETLDPMTSLRSDVLYVFLESWLVLWRSRVGFLPVRWRHHNWIPNSLKLSLRRDGVFFGNLVLFEVFFGEKGGSCNISCLSIFLGEVRFVKEMDGFCPRFLMFGWWISAWKGSKTPWPHGVMTQKVWLFLSGSFLCVFGCYPGQVCKILVEHSTNWTAPWFH